MSGKNYFRNIVIRIGIIFLNVVELLLILIPSWKISVRRWIYLLEEKLKMFFTLEQIQHAKEVVRNKIIQEKMDKLIKRHDKINKSPSGEGVVL